MNPKRLRTASAVQLNGGANGVSLDHKVLATCKIGQILPIFHAACVPGDKFTVRSSMFSRFEPLSVPSYVDLDYRTMSVFVPYHQIADGCESFFANQMFYKGQDNALPRVSYNTWSNFWCNHLQISHVSGSSDPIDFYQGDNNQSPHYFTPLGRYAAKVATMLGYRIGRRFPSETQSNPRQDFNLLPLLAFAHAYNSFMSYSPDFNTSALSTLLESIKRDPTQTIDEDELFLIFSSILLTYEESFYTLAWRNPFLGQTGVADERFTDVSLLSMFQGNLPDGASPIFATPTDTRFDEEIGAYKDLDFSENLSAQQIRLLLKFDDFFKRSSFAGSKDIEQIYSRFGVQIEDYKTRYPHFLNESSSRVRIGDVTSTADTEGAAIGDYAGKAIADADCSFHFESKDYGMLITFGWFAPRPLYFTGYDPEVLRLQPFDFYTPELDQGFATPLRRLRMQSDSVSTRDVGYQLLYADYLFPQDIICGDYTRFDGYEDWHFGRMDLDADIYAQGDALIYMPCTGTQFERIFNITDTTLVDVDTCKMTIQNAVSADRPMKDFVGKTGLGQGSVDVQLNGSQVN